MRTAIQALVTQSSFRKKHTSQAGRQALVPYDQDEQSREEFKSHSKQ